MNEPQSCKNDECKRSRTEAGVETPCQKVCYRGMTRLIEQTFADCLNMPRLSKKARRQIAMLFVGAADYRAYLHLAGIDPETAGNQVYEFADKFTEWAEGRNSG